MPRRTFFVRGRSRELGNTAMRHRKAGRQFGRNTSHRRAMLRALTANLVAHERIETTDAKAKELRRVAERLITRARRLGPTAYTPFDKLNAADRSRRQAAQRQIGRFLRRFAVIQEEGEPRKIDLVEKVFVDLAKRFANRPGGYTRIIKVGRRRGDNAPMSIIELVDSKEPSKVKKKAKADAKTTDKPAAKADEKKAEAKKPDDKKVEAKKPDDKKAEAKPAAKAKAAKPDEKKAEKPAAKTAAKKPAGASAKGADKAEKAPKSKAPAKKAAKKTDE